MSLFERVNNMMKTVLNQLTGDEIVSALIRVMTDHFPDFAKIHGRYEEAMAMLQEELGEEPVLEETDAIGRQISSDLVFSGLLGVKANLDNFVDPLRGNFLNADAEIYLREATAHRLPKYEEAQKMRKRFYKSLSARQQEIYEDVTAYVSYLETVGPKLAHYCGYILGNELLYLSVPGYHPDPVLTIRYASMIRQYFGKVIPLDIP